MGRTYVFPRKKSGVACAHSIPALKTPWWEWTCATCTPDCWKAFTEPDFRAVADRPGEAECPMCLWTVAYKDGRFRRHQEDRGNDCRCSGISEQVAQRYLTAMLAGQSVEAFVRASLERRGIAGAAAPAPVEKPKAETLHAELAERRYELGWTQPRLAKLMKVATTTIAGWETGRKNPQLGYGIRWAQTLGMRLFIEDHPVDTQSAAATYLAARRSSSLNQTADRIGVDSRSLSNWESGRTTLRMMDLQDWADAFDLKVELRLEDAA